MKRICTIAARGGSKGVKNKNIRPLAGKPLITHTIVQAEECGLFDSIAVSSDSDRILALAADHGAVDLVHRPPDLARDESSKLAAIRHCVATIEERKGERFDTVVDLDVTSPLRGIEDIVRCLEVLESSGVGNVITGCLARRSPYFNLVEVDESGVARLSKAPKRPFFRRQDSPACYDMNAAVYAWRRDALFAGGDTVFLADTALVVMPEERSLDIDGELDFAMVEFLMDWGKGR